jgi:galactose oxidase-like protein
MKRALVLLLLAACSKDNILDITLIEPVGENPLSDATSIRISAGSHTQTAPVTNGHYTITFNFQTTSPAELVPVVVDAFAADGTTVVAHGSTPTIQLTPATGNLFVYLARPGSLGSPLGPDGSSPTSITARTRHAAAYYPGLGIFVAGGRDAVGPVNTVSLWFQYELVESTNALWVLGIARSDPAFGYDGAYLEIVGGTDVNGNASSIGEVMDPTGSIGVPETVTVVTQGMTSVARTQAAAAFGSEGFLLFGGLGSDGHPQSGAILYTVSAGSKPVSWLNAVPRVGATATAILNGQQIIVFGGGPAGMPVMEKYVSQTSATVVTPDPTTNRTGHSATALPNGTILFAGGNDDAGNPLATATVYDPVANTAREIPAFLQAARSGHTATLAKDVVVVAGGQAGPNLVGTVEVFDATTLAPRSPPIPMRVPRTHHTATDPGNDSCVILGGEDAMGAPTGVVEIYQP